MNETKDDVKVLTRMFFGWHDYTSQALYEEMAKDNKLTKEFFYDAETLYGIRETVLKKIADGECEGKLEWYGQTGLELTISITVSELQFDIKYNVALGVRVQIRKIRKVVK